MENSIDLGVVDKYVKAMGGYVVVVTVLFCFAIPVAGVTGASWFLSYWISQGGGVS